jgi:hypothetical protein
MQETPMPSFLDHFDTDHLARMRREMSPNVHDGTGYAHVVAFIRSLISRELADPERVERDKQAAAQRAEEAKEREKAELDAKHEAERAALQPAPTAEERASAEMAELEKRQAAEREALAARHAPPHPDEGESDRPSDADPRRPDTRDPQFARPRV